MIKRFALAAIGYQTLINKNECVSKVPTQELIQRQRRSAICIIIPEFESTVRGIVSFHQESFLSTLKIVANLSGLNPNSLHSININEFGDITELSKSTGHRFDRYNLGYGESVNSNKHSRDLGNFRTDERGNAYLATENGYLILYGDNSILGRAIVIASDEDDLGKKEAKSSKSNDSSKKILGCGVIGLANRFKNLSPS